MMLTALHSSIMSMAGAISDVLAHKPRQTLPADLLSVANAVLDEISREGGSANLIRLQRLTILSQLWHVAIHDRPMFTDAMVVLSGRPALLGIHSAFRRHGMDPITGRARIPEVPQFEYPSDDDEGRLEIVGAVVKAYDRFTDYRLGEILTSLIGAVNDGGTVDQRLAAQRLLASLKQD